MTMTIPSLWPDDIKIDVLPPLLILRHQAGKIREITRGILEGEVTTVTGSGDFVSHRLDLLAPSLEGRRHRVLTATHRADFYPVVIEAERFRPKPRPAPFLAPAGFNPAIMGALAGALAGEVDPWPPKDDWRPVVANQDEFLARVGEVLRSGEVRSAIDSMIALSNEKSVGEEPADDSDAPPAEVP